MQFIMVSHGDLAKAMLGSAEMIVGKQERVQAFGLEPTEDVSTLRAEVQARLNEIGPDEGVICFTDLFSGSPFNTVVSLMADYGMNLPMMLEAFMMRSNPSNDREAICEKLIKEAPSTFIDVNKHLAKETDD
ncbi:PTS sugar transporter subunit IIA [Lacticaseibacillus paracasei]|uniref:PTS sugar transporter subunit IIA n=1 Tax=Lacticaseibacillus paracasei TaxID=1597 RepID=UPI002F26A3CC